MGLRERLAGQQVYFDTNIFIYAFENAPLYREQLASLASILDDKECVALTSEFTLSEILTKPFRYNMLEAVGKYREVLEGGEIHLAPITRSVLVRSAMLRGQLGLKTPDAIHVATAVETGCSRLLTNDASIRLPKSIELVLFSDS